MRRCDEVSIVSEDGVDVKPRPHSALAALAAEAVHAVAARAAECGCDLFSRTAF